VFNIEIIKDKEILKNLAKKKSWTILGFRKQSFCPDWSIRKKHSTTPCETRMGFWMVFAWLYHRLKTSILVILFSHGKG
jgi:hypothetical protein